MDLNFKVTKNVGSGVGVNQEKLLKSQRKICKKEISFNVTIKDRSHYPFSYIHYHGDPFHAMLVYIDRNYAIRDSESIQEISGVFGQTGKFSKNCVVTGDWGVGKNSLIYQIVDNKFLENYTPTTTLGAQAREFIFSDDLSIKVHFWEVAGQKSNTNIMMRKRIFPEKNTDLVPCDVTRQSSFDLLDELLDDLRYFDGESCDILCLAYKIDVTDQRIVSPEKLKEMETKYGIPFYEISVKTRDNLDDFLSSWLNRLLKQNTKL